MRRLFFFVVNSVTSFALTNINNINSISMLNGTDFKTWKEKISIVLDYIDLDLSLKKE